MKIVIIHGTLGNSKRNWFPWLKDILEKQGHQVWTPDLPTPNNQTPDHRCEELQKQVPFIFDHDTVLIGHSLGAVYLLHILDREREEPIKKSIFISGFTHLLGNKTYDTLNKPFLEKDFNREKIRKNSKDILIFHGDNDPYVPTSEAEDLHQKLGGTLYIIPGGGHLNAEAGFTTFNQLLENI